MFQLKIILAEVQLCFVRVNLLFSLVLCVVRAVRKFIIFSSVVSD